MLETLGSPLFCCSQVRNLSFREHPPFYIYVFPVITTPFGTRAVGNTLRVCQFKNLALLHQPIILKCGACAAS